MKTHLGAIFLKTVIDKSLNWSPKCSNHNFNYIILITLRLWLIECCSNLSVEIWNCDSIQAFLSTIVCWGFVGSWWYSTFSVMLWKYKIKKKNVWLKFNRWNHHKMNIPQSCCSLYFECRLLESVSWDQRSTPQ